MAIYMWREPSYITTAWIYHNEDLWLISLSSDWSNWITIADKNLWATTIYNYWDNRTDDNCGYFYQRWSSHAVSISWSISTYSDQLDVSNYWPWNYFNPSVFYKWYTSYMLSWNENMRWYLTWTWEAMRWPCEEWFHVPTSQEWLDLRDTWIALSAWTQRWSKTFSTIMKIPWYWSRTYNQWDVNQSWNWFYRCSDWTSVSEAKALYFDPRYEWQSYSKIGVGTYYVNSWFFIRPFKNEAVQPDDSRTVLYQ